MSPKSKNVSGSQTPKTPCEKQLFEQNVTIITLNQELERTKNDVTTKTDTIEGLRKTVEEITKQLSEKDDAIVTLQAESEKHKTDHEECRMVKEREIDALKEEIKKISGSERDSEIPKEKRMRTDEKQTIAVQRLVVSAPTVRMGSIET